MKYLLGIDVSTTGVKALVIDQAGKVIASANTEQPLSTPRPLWSEQDPADWWQGTVSSVQQALVTAGIASEEIAAVGLTGQMHGLTLLDEKGQVLRPAILWNDQRTASQCDEIRARLGRKGAQKAAKSNSANPNARALQARESIRRDSARNRAPAEIRIKATGSFCHTCIQDSSGRLYVW